MKMEEFFRRIGSVTMKLTMGCNLKCVYCNTETVTPKTPMMSIELWKHVAKLVMENSTSRYIGLEFHGGEPLLLSDEWFAEASDYAFAMARKNRKLLDLPMVTNGTLLTEERLLKLERMGISFCISCDGPPEVNDILRGSGHAVQRAIRLFLDRGIDVGIMTVVSHANYSRMTDVMQWYRDLGVQSFGINFLQPQGRGIDSPLLSGEQMFQGMRQVLDHMVETDCSVYEAEMGQFVERFVEGRGASTRHTCWDFECQAGRSYVAIDLHGNVHPCGSDSYHHAFGNVYEDLDEARYERTLHTLHDKSAWYIRCFDCAAQQICNHSCATSDYNDPQYKEHECRFTKLLWTHLCEHPEKAYHVHEIARRRGQHSSRAFVPVSDLVQSAPAGPHFTPF